MYLWGMDREEREREQRIAAETEPEIREALARGEEARSVAERIASRHGIEELKAYRWVSYIDEEHQKRRRRLAGLALTIMWIGAVAAAVGVGALIFAATALVWIFVAAGGAILAVPALIVALFSRRIAYRRRFFQ